MKPPKFWFKAPEQFDLRTLLLAPLAKLYAAGTAKRLANGGREKMDVPIICVGNVNVGGTGKTPTVIALLEILQTINKKAAVISRGYKGSLDGPVKVNGDRHKASQVGDEPILLSAFADVWVAKDRLKGAEAAVDAGAEILILDDGLQNPSLSYDLTICVVDAEIRFGNGRVMPAGPLREPAKVGLARSDMVVSIGGAFDQTDLPVLPATLAPIEMGMDWSDTYAVAFAGIARPEKFFNTLRGLGATLVATHAFDDHEPYSEMILSRLEREAFQKAAILVTTEKDAARLPPDWRHMVLSLPVRLKFEDDAPLRSAIKSLF